jgi:hypothetical protein
MTTWMLVKEEMERGGQRHLTLPHSLTIYFAHEPPPTLSKKSCMYLCEMPGFARDLSVNGAALEKGFGPFRGTLVRL